MAALYKKNDACFIEQKNNSTVRRNAGWFRYDANQRATLERLFERLSLYTNFFQPSMKLLSKTRKGAKTYRKYDTPHTPLRRALAHPELPAKTKKLLKSIYTELNLGALRREIDAMLRNAVAVESLAVHCGLLVRPCFHSETTLSESRIN